MFDNITGSSSDGPIRTYIHKVRYHLVRKGSAVAWLTLACQIYPWTEIQEAHREMEANKNRSATVQLL